MVLIGVALVFLVVGAWDHGRKLAIVLFLCFVLLGVWDLRRPGPGLTQSAGGIGNAVLQEFWQ